MSGLPGRAGRRREPDPEPALPPRLAADLERGTTVDAMVVARVRRTVLSAFSGATEEAGSTLDATRRERDGDGRLVPGRRPLPRRSILRPLAPLGLAATLVIAAGGLVAANSGPGGVFYETRLAAEELGLPLLGEANQLTRLDERLAEARRESSNSAAASAALRAYQNELRRTIAGTQSESDRQSVLDALDTHAAVLDELAQELPAAAADGLRQAREQVRQAESSLRKTVASPAPGGGADRPGKPESTRRPR